MGSSLESLSSVPKISNPYISLVKFQKARKGSDWLCLGQVSASSGEEVGTATGMVQLYVLGIISQKGEVSGA